jgi:hypothetical protein
MSRPTKPVAMCYVSVNYTRLLMPADKGMKLVELLQSAFECEQDYATGGYTYAPKEEQLEVAFVLVRPNQVRTSKAASPGRSGPLLLGSD